jgi:TRAP-type C4-dicarboxylate transport system substrate-binding protein
MGRRKIRICRIVTTVIAGVLSLLPQPVGAQKNIKVALALSRDLPGIDFINGMYEVFKSHVEARTTSALTVEIIYGGVLGNPVSRMNQMRTGAIQMSDASDGNYATVYPDIQVLNTLPVCIENLIRFDCVVESHNVSAFRENILSS